MAEQHIYPPPPSANHEEDHPYGNQQRMRSTEHSQIPPPAAANMQGDPNDMQGFGQANLNGQVYGQPHPPTPQQLAQRGLAVGPNHNGLTQDSPSSRSKASRACDECRRKKTKCDADSEDGIQCSACRRANQTCAFTRPPQKRGPSRGYIKEIELRLHQVERQLGPNHPAMQYQPIAVEGSGAYPSPAGYSTRKRTYDMVGDSPPYKQLQPQFQDYVPQQQITHSDNLQTEDQTARAIQPPLLNPDPASKMYVTLAKNAQQLDMYYDIIHPHFPLLAKSRLNMQLVLNNVPSSLCEAFFAALKAAVTSCTSADTEPLQEATNLLEPYRTEELRTRTPGTNLTHLQAMILMIVAVDNSGPSDAKESRWYAEADRIAKFMQLHHSHAFIFEDSEDSNTALGRRAWLVLATLDRWHAVSTIGALQVTEINAQLFDEDELLLGSQAYHLARLSLLLGQLTDGFLFNSSALAEPSRLVMTRVMYSSIENFRKSVQSRLPTMPHLHLAFLHLKLLADRHLENNRPNATRVHDGAQQMVTLLLQNPGASPLTHHWAGLAAITLAEFQDGAIAQRALRDLRGGFQSGHIRQWKGKALIWDTAIVGYITKKLEHTQDSSDSIAGDRGPLGQLADAALNKNPVKSGQAGNIPDGIREYEVPMDWSAATMNGYLNSFAEDDG